MDKLFQGTQICLISGETQSEERINFLTHGIGLALSIAGLFFLFELAFFSTAATFTFSLIVYGLALVLMYFSSTLYHGCLFANKKRRYRIFDHVCIYVLIAGCYTPVVFHVLEPLNAWYFTAAIWGVALIGGVLKIFFTGKFVFASTALYLLMGWCCILIFDALKTSLSEQGFIWLALGGLIYTLGVVFYLWEKLPYNHSIWHLCVLGGSSCHYYLIAFHIAV